MRYLPVEKNKNYIMKIDRLGFEGEGVGRIEGFAVFVPYALPGEEIEIRIVKVNKSYAFGKLVRILSRSPERVESLCNLKGCGGCQLMHLSYGAQLRFKRQRVLDSIERIGKLKGVEVNGTLGMQNPYRYRNKAMFPVGMEGGRITVGFYAPRSHRIIDTRSCLIQDEVSDRVIAIIKRWGEGCGISVYDETTGDGLLRHIMVRKAFRTGEVMVAAVTNGYEMPNSDRLVQMLRDGIEGLKTVVQNINTEKGNTALGAENRILYGSGFITDCIGNLKFRISPQSFFQVNPVQAEVLYRKALEYAGLSGRETVIDAYCGTGCISLFLAGRAKKVYGIEVVQPAVEDAIKNAEANNINNVEFIAGRSETVIPELYKKGIRADAIVVDPPRKGCAPELLRTISDMRPGRIVYVSCDPGTLARDLKYLSGCGFKAEQIQPVDMFPFTSHVETVVLITRNM